MGERITTWWRVRRRGGTRDTPWAEPQCAVWPPDYGRRSHYIHTTALQGYRNAPWGNLKRLNSTWTMGRKRPKPHGTPRFSQTGPPWPPWSHCKRSIREAPVWHRSKSIVYVYACVRLRTRISLCCSWCRHYIAIVRKWIDTDEINVFFFFGGGGAGVSAWQCTRYVDINMYVCDTLPRLYVKLNLSIWRENINQPWNTAHVLVMPVLCHTLCRKM